MRDRFLLLGATALLSSGQREEAEKLRLRLLELNPSHLLKPFASLAEALKSRDIVDYVAGLRRSYPPQTAEHLLESLKRDSGRGTNPNKMAASPQAAPELPALESVGSRRPGGPGKSFPSSAKPNEQPQSPPPPAPANSAGGAVKSRFNSPVRAWAESPRASWREGWSDGDRREPPSGAWGSTLVFSAALIAAVALVGYLIYGAFVRL
jgi:hypothetical protein